MFRLDVGNNIPNIAIEFNVPAPPPTLITVTGGGTQAATVGTPFGAPLQAKVTDAGGNPSSRSNSDILGSGLGSLSDTVANPGH